MPLHLLGKKSWNVYNRDNIARVKRDEAAARAKEQAEEEQMQKVDAERRLRILRSERPEPLDIVERADIECDQQKSLPGSRRERKRKRFGETDTDFELRLAREGTKPSAVSENSAVLRKQISNAPVTNEAGHINLFPQDDRKVHVKRNSEAQAEAARGKNELENQYNLRFSDAAGSKQGLEKPWYSKLAAAPISDEAEAPRKDMWGNEDPLRKSRDVARLASSDPLIAMRQGAAKVREMNRERRRLKTEREQETLGLQMKESRRRKRRMEDDFDDSIEELDLNDSGKSTQHDRDKSKGGSQDSRRHHKHRSRDRERSRHRHEY